MKIYNLVVLGDNWVSSTPYINLDDAVNDVNKMVEGQKYLEGSDKVDVHEIKDYEMLCLPIRLDCGEKKYAVETRSLFRGEITTMWRVVYEQEVK
jgi:hypothetical protein